MGWKASLVIIENTTNLHDDQAILKVLGKENYQFKEDVTLGSSLYPNDGSINIGYYNGNIVISDDFEITNNSLERASGLNLTSQEKALVKLFPESEIVMVACHSGVNYHGYALISHGKKVRLKTISSEDARREWGVPTAEEQAIYVNATMRKGKPYFKSEYDSTGEYSEDQMMELFTFGFAKRRLGVRIDHGESDELKDKVVFKKYVDPNHKPDESGGTKKQRNIPNWVIYVGGFLLVLAWRIFRKTMMD